MSKLGDGVYFTCFGAQLNGSLGCFVEILKRDDLLAHEKKIRYC